VSHGQLGRFGVLGTPKVPSYPDGAKFSRPVRSRPTSNSCSCSSEVLERLGYSARIVDFRFFECSDLLRGKHDYLLEITRDRQETHAT
jgi:hypothetical protein